MLDLDDEFPEYHELDAYHSQQLNPPITLASIENAYIIFWISKDMFWSFGTGDLTPQRDIAIVCEIFAMCFGFTALCVYLITAYIYRRRKLRFLDGLTAIFWISANYVWMCGEFFIRYHNLEHDDGDAGDDRSTRIAAATLFTAGFVTQLYVGSVLYWRYRKRIAGRTGTGNGASASPYIDVFGKGMLKYQTISVNFSPQHSHAGQGQVVADSTFSSEDEEHTVLF
jgi:hypothetical protein